MFRLSYHCDAGSGRASPCPAMKSRPPGRLARWSRRRTGCLARGKETVMTMNGLRTLVTGRGLVESPRWHGDRLNFSDWTAGGVLAGDPGGPGEGVARVRS